MKTAAKVALVAAGYGLALLAAWAVLEVYIALNNTPDRSASGGMSAFGDMLLFLAVFGLLATVPTGAGMYFLRAWGALWRPLAFVALAVAATGVMAILVYVAAQLAGPAALTAWSGWAVLRILAAPLFALAFFVAGVFAPQRFARVALLGAAAVETAGFAVFLGWALVMRLH